MTEPSPPLSPQAPRRAPHQPRDLPLTMVTLRRLKGWSQQELAAAAGLAAPTVKDFEAGRNIGIHELTRLLAALGGDYEMIEALRNRLYELDQKMARHRRAVDGQE